MKFSSIQKSFKIFTGVKFALFLLSCIAIFSSLGSFIEQEEPQSFYEQNYPVEKPIFGILTSKIILLFGLDHIYRTWWFWSLLIFLVISLISCTFTRQFPIFSNSKNFFFKKKKKSFLELPFCVKLKNFAYLKENVLLKLQLSNFFIYQKENFLYGYKGLIGRISPILVHFSLIMILGGGFFGAFNNFKAQEILPKGELFHIQNPLQIGWFTNLPSFSIRINDFWVEYQENRIHQFYSNLSILDSFGNEKKQQTISVNNPLRYEQIDFYQSDWNLVGIRFEKSELNKNNEIQFGLKKQKTKKIYEAPVFSLPSKTWITWINSEDTNFRNEKKSSASSQLNPIGKEKTEKTYTILFDQLQETFNIYDNKGNFLGRKNIGESLPYNFCILDFIPSTGLQIKYDPSISIIYFGFGILMITACLSYLPYTQIWFFKQSSISWLGGSTNRGKIKLEIEFENLIRSLEKSYYNTLVIEKRS